jgi:hypothetical protein
VKDKNDNKTIDAFKLPPKTTAERQQDFRARKKDRNNFRLDEYISYKASLELKRLKLSTGLSKAQLLEILILKTDLSALAGVDQPLGIIALTVQPTTGEKHALAAVNQLNSMSFTVNTIFVLIVILIMII